MKKIRIMSIILLVAEAGYTQKPNWQNLDLQQDKVFGISADRAYKELLKDKKPKKVIIGIIDSGIDTLHEDLKDVIWTDQVSGHHGWNYIGPETGREDIVLLSGNNNKLYDSLAFAGIPDAYRAGYQGYRKYYPGLVGKIGAMKDLIAELTIVKAIADTIVQKIGKSDPLLIDFENYSPENGSEAEVVKRILKSLKYYPDWDAYRYREIDNILDIAKHHLSHGLNQNNLEADTAKGNDDISPDKLGPIGNPNMTAYHGTHVAGIVGAIRGNHKGMDGVADNVEILMLKENGTIREMRDEALARAIRYAVDHGAKIINLSFGKPYTWNKKLVDEAVKYAIKKDVLLVHGAGNEGINLDDETRYPSPVYADGTGRAAAWLEVGASGPKDDQTLVANFSNYSHTNVDVFAPGVQIYSTLPNNGYGSWDGTSMATPVVAGVAALIREYYPKLSAVQVKEIIMKTVVRRDILNNKCVSGGVVNAYNALLLAEQLTNYKKKKPASKEAGDQ